MLNSRRMAIRESMNSFFNSYVRDFNPKYDLNGHCFQLRIRESILRLKVVHYSLVGAHEFEGITYDDQEIDFEQALHLICDDKNFVSRVHNSVCNIELSLRDRITIDQIHKRKINFLTGEQGLIFGHNFHPFPKSRDEFSDEDLKNYSPDFRASFKLGIFFVHEKIVEKEISDHFKNIDWQKKIISTEVPDGHIAYPVHPWQREHLKKDPIIKKYLSQGLIIDAGELEGTWYATSSLRTVYNPYSPFMLKFSMNLKMTNSMRHLQKKEAARGMVIQDILQTKSGKKFSADFPYFKIMHEPLYLGIIDENNNVMPQSIFLIRENIIPENQEIVVLATLCQKIPLTNDFVISKYLKKCSPEDWFIAFLDKVITPLLIAQANYGIYLGAHMQNLLICLDEGIPVGAYFRDCQGTAVSSIAVESMLDEFCDKERLLSLLLPQEDAAKIFIYYVFINSVFSTISTIAKVGEIQEVLLLRILKNKLSTLFSKVKDTSVFQELLQKPELLQKGNFRCSMQDINENTSRNPLAIYNKMKNPLLEGKYI